MTFRFMDCSSLQARRLERGGSMAPLALLAVLPEVHVVGSMAGRAVLGQLRDVRRLLVTARACDVAWAPVKAKGVALPWSNSQRFQPLAEWQASQSRPSDPLCRSSAE